MLREFWRLYVQDFDVVFERNTDPIDLFCQQHSRQAQEELLDELRGFCAEVLAGRRSVADLVNLGLEYMPGDEQHPETWLPQLVKYLEERIVAPN
jgi:hypothetical protein